MKKSLIIALLAGLITNNSTYSSASEIARHAAYAAGVSGVIATCALNDTIGQAEILRGMARGASGVGGAAGIGGTLTIFEIAARFFSIPGQTPEAHATSAKIGSFVTVLGMGVSYGSYRLLKYAILG